MCVDIKVNTNIINLQKSLADKFTLPNAEEKTSGYHIEKKFVDNTTYNFQSLYKDKNFW